MLFILNRNALPFSVDASTLKHNQTHKIAKLDLIFQSVSLFTLGYEEIHQTRSLT